MIINLTTPMSDDKERERHTKAVLDAIEQYTEERMDDAYGRIHTDGSRSGGQPAQSDALREASEHERFYKTVPMVGTIPENSRGGGGTGLQPVVCGKVAAAGPDRIGGAGVVMHSVVVYAQIDALREENKRLREHLISALDTLKDAEVCDDNCDPCNEARAELEQSK